MTHGHDEAGGEAFRPHERLALHDERRSAGTLGTSLAIVLLVLVGVATGLLALFLSGDEGLDRALPLTIAGAAVTCYLAAAATGIRWMAWVWVAVSTAILVIAELVDVPRLLALVVSGAVIAAVGLVRRRGETLRQTIVALVYLAVGILALVVDPRLGLAVAGLALAVHAVWDVVHLRRDAVVSRSLALWCLGLDVTVGVVCIAAALTL